MQRLFAPGGPWPTPWMPRVLPVVAALAERFAARTIFTRFMPPERPEDLGGSWRRYYERWREVTRERIAPAMLELMPELAAVQGKAEVIDKETYSAFEAPALVNSLRKQGVDTVIVTGAETDVCVAATVLGAVDRGYRVVVVADAICSSTDEGHDALLGLYRNRFSQQIETVESAEILDSWRP
ncbi:MAG: cysteine hydrolase [Alphaproteobacteria bacterium]|nr:cysteine hydrolase [Alphaproteobacteria bacterium]